MTICPGEKKRISDTFLLASGEHIVCERDGSVVEMDVTDTGARMTSQQLAELGREGIQFNVNELQAGRGSGLGLFIARGIVEQHGGHLVVSSAGLGMGTTFTCRLPLYYYDCASPPPETTGLSTVPLSAQQRPQPQESPQPKPTLVEKKNLRPLRVLVVDDVATNRKLLARILSNNKDCPIITEQACDGREAVHKVSDRLLTRKDDDKDDNNEPPYDVILMDYEMPHLKGPEAAQEIRKLGCHSLIIGITGNLLADDIRHFLSCGANHVLPKPVDISKLEELWREHGLFSSSSK